jgi:hypothetical protein
MRNLQLEALESRRVLNGNSVSAQLLPPQAPSAATPIFWLTERLTFIDYPGRTEVVMWGWSGEGSMPIGRVRIAFGGFDGSGRDMHSLQAYSRITPADPSAAQTGSEVDRVSANSSGADPAFAGGRGTTPRSFVAPAVAPAGPANSSTSGATLPAILLQRLSPPHLSFLETPVAVRNLPSDVQGLFALRAPVQAPKVSEGVLGYAGSYGEQSRQTSGTSTADHPQQEAVLPSPKVADLLAVLPFLDDAALDVGIKQFLEQLERLCPRLANDGESSAAWPWIVAVTAAATAGEIARRELKRPPVASVGEYDQTGWFPPDRFFAG